MAEVIKTFVETPKGRIIEVKYGNGKTVMKLEWNKGFSAKWNVDFSSAQKFIDSACIQYMAPYTPMRSGLLMESAKLGTQIGSGEIRQVAPYARYLYYGIVYGPNIPMYENGELIGFWSPKKKHPTGRAITYSTAVHPQAGKQWFERMKADRKPEILRGAAKILGGRIR